MPIKFPQFFTGKRKPWKGKYVRVDNYLLIEVDVEVDVYDSKITFLSCWSDSINSVPDDSLDTGCISQSVYQLFGYFDIASL